MLADAMGGRWLFRRDPAIGGSLGQMTCRTADGIPFLAPEVQLLYKATGTLRVKDEADFAAVLPSLPAGRRNWLARAIHRCQPTHPWLTRLATKEV
jgi:hypothetical protein